MAEVAEPPPWLERWNRTRIALAGAVGVLGPVGGIAFTPLIGDLMLGAIGLGVAGLAAWAWQQRTELERLPLVLGDCAVRQVVGGEPALRVRMWLGHGRRMEGLEATGALELPDGRRLALVVEIPAQVASGPLTLTVPLPPLALGTVHLAVSAVGKGVPWRAEGAYPLSAAVPGPLDVPVRRRGARLVWDRAAWDRPLSGG